VELRIYLLWEAIYHDNDAFDIRQTWEASDEDKGSMVSFYRIIEALLAEDKLRVMPREIKQGELESVLSGVCLFGRFQ
jgi:hypothetical protein